MWTNWNDDKIAIEAQKICDSLGWFPSNSDLRSMGRNDLACAISRNGGLIEWSNRLGIPRRHSDSDTGWLGEHQFSYCMKRNGHTVSMPGSVKSPYDIMVDDVLRVDVKSANFAEYGACRGWFYRIAKHPQADVIVLWQLDTSEFYGLPYWICPTTNVTISRGGGKYKAYKNNLGMIEQMIDRRKQERLAIP